MYKSSGKESEFYELKPKLTEIQIKLLSAFYRLSQERETESGAPLPIKDRDIHYYQKYNGSCGYDADLFVMAINGIDQEYVTQKCEEIRRKMKKGK